ncbi:molybdopterin dinucleotide binding domain-containing protein [Alkaliphilus serpentinus]|uniref:Molybdopterin dinucleotide-binding domain-containing protein n=1 Tax=Alkaliphilus serpentinus TaxID=1482731 RepID=A0A833HR28_9FIRM|nr:molybdopterin dinucleotide binding domain-containing protein [Alkaliphilus serpentinus]KAB3532519.1 hypothetical protein F8153_02460 [Alkaliphilus serpentinus]
MEFIIYEKVSANYPLQLLTIHPMNSLHSQHFMEEEAGKVPIIHTNKKTLNKYDCKDGEVILLVSPWGKLKGKILLDESIRDYIVALHEGWWLKNQGVNKLTPTGLSDIGNQAIYNNCYCKIEKL